MKKLLLSILLSCVSIAGYSPSVGETVEKYYKKEVQSYEARVKSLLHAFLIAESGGDYSAPGLSGEYGGYQFLPDTWRMYCKKLIGRVLDITIPANQDLVARKKLERLIHAGYSDKQIAAIWNCGSSNYENRRGINKYGVYYDVPAYVEKVTKLADAYKKNTFTI